MDIYYSTLFYFYFLLFNLLIGCSEGTYNNGKGLNCTGVKIQLPCYFEKCSLTSRKVLWVVLSSLFFKETQWKNGTSGHWRVLQVLNESNKCNWFDSYSVGKSVVIILHDYYLSGLPYIFFPTIFLRVAMCYEEFLIQSVRQFDKSINHTFSLQWINKSNRQSRTLLRACTNNCYFWFCFFVFLFFVFCFLFCFLFCFFVFALSVLVGWVVSFSVVLFCFFVCLFHYLLNLLQRHCFVLFCLFGFFCA